LTLPGLAVSEEEFGLSDAVIESLSKKSLAFVAAGKGVAVIDRDLRKQIANLSLNITPLDVALHPTDKVLYVLGTRTPIGGITVSKLFRVNSSNLAVLSTYDFSYSFRAENLYVDPVGKVYVSGEHLPTGKGFIHVFWGGALSPTHYVSFLGSPKNISVASIAFSPDGSRAFVGGSPSPGYVYEVNWISKTLYGHHLGAYTEGAVSSISEEYGKLYVTKMTTDKIIYLKYAGGLDRQAWPAEAILVDIDTHLSRNLYGVGLKLDMGMLKKAIYKAGGLKSTSSSTTDFSLPENGMITTEKSAWLSQIPSGRIAQSISVSADGRDLYVLDAAGVAYPVNVGRALHVYDSDSLTHKWSVNVTPYVMPFTKAALTKNKILWNYSPPSEDKFFFEVGDIVLPKNIFEFASNGTAPENSSSGTGGFSFELGSLFEPDLKFPFFEIPENATYPDNSSSDAIPEEVLPEEIPDPIPETSSSSGGSGSSGSSGSSGGFGGSGGSGGAVLPSEIVSSTGNDSITAHIRDLIAGGALSEAESGPEPTNPGEGKLAEKGINPQPEPPKESKGISIPIISPLLDFIAGLFRGIFGGGK